MLTDILNFFKFITDSETRDTVAQIFSVVSAHQKNWQAEVKSTKAHFAGDESYKISVFVNHLLNELKTSGVSSEKISNFQTVLAELINNAFEHGCKHSKNCEITVQIIYSRWFIHLQVTDTGNGFDLSKKLAEQTIDYYDNKPKIRHGLQVVKNLSYKLDANKSGNSITAILAGQDSLDIIPSVEEYEGQDLFIISVTAESDWYYMIADWKPILHAVENVKQNLILIDCQQIRWNTKSGREMVKVTTELSSQYNKFFALLVDDDATNLFDLDAFNTDNLQTFLNKSHARDWLVGNSKKQRRSSSK